MKKMYYNDMIGQEMLFIGENGHELSGILSNVTSVCLILTDVVIKDELGCVEKSNFFNLKLSYIDERWKLM